MASTQLNVLDIASYQQGLNASTIAADAVIVKATEGTNYSNPGFSKHPQQVLSAGKLLGLYHFARRGTSWKAEADYFIARVKPYLGKATLWLDWEAGAVQNGVAWAKAWLDYVHKQTGIRPGIYMGLADENKYAWNSVAAAGYPLWVAQYNNYNAVWGYHPRTLYGHLVHKWQFAMFQYTSSGRLNGWNASLDLDVYYGSRADWQKMAGAAAKTITKKKEADILPAAKLRESRIAGVVYIRENVQVYADNMIEKPIKGKMLKPGTAWLAYGKDGSVINLGGNQWVAGKGKVFDPNPLKTPGANIRGTIIATGGTVHVYDADGKDTGKTLKPGKWKGFAVSKNGKFVNAGGADWLRIQDVGFYM